MASEEKPASSEVSGERADGQGDPGAPEKSRRRSKKAASEARAAAAARAVRWRRAAIALLLTGSLAGLVLLLWPPPPPPHRGAPPPVPNVHCPPLPVAPGPYPQLGEEEAELLQGLREEMLTDAAEVPPHIDEGYTKELFPHAVLREELEALWLHATFCVGLENARSEAEPRAQDFLKTWPQSRWAPVVRRELVEPPQQQP